MKFYRTASFWIFATSLVLAYCIGRLVPPVWVAERVSLDVKLAADGSRYYEFRGEPRVLHDVGTPSDSELWALWESQSGGRPSVLEEFVMTEEAAPDGSNERYYLLRASRHWRWWSLLPAVTAILMCWVTREPITSLLSGIFVGALLMGKFDLTDAVFLESLSTKSAAGILLLYLVLLGGLLGIWSKTGAAQAFAEVMTRHFVRGPVSARLVAWFLGVIFFQGGTISTVLVGTTVKPLADKERVSHEELSYIVDSTASPIACLLAFNAWPGYVQAFIYVAGVEWLATEELRISFFFGSIWLSFYAIFAILGTFLLAIDKAPFLNRQMRQAIQRSRETGQLDAPGAQPLSAKELQASTTPEGYRPTVWEFAMPILLIIGVAIGTFGVTGSPQVRWAFGAAVLYAAGSAMLRGMRLKDLIAGFNEGLKGVVGGFIILMLAMTIGGISRQTGGASFLVELFGESIPYWTLPFALLILTGGIAFATGTSFGTYAVAFPLAMPLSWAVAQSTGVGDPMFFMMLCFAAVMNGSVWGDQCSPISDTTVLSSLSTGCDLMDHVKTQFYPATIAAGAAGVLWTLLALFFV